MELQITCIEQASLLPVTALEFGSITGIEFLLAGEKLKTGIHFPGACR